jgi:hypothetical protein
MGTLTSLEWNIVIQRRHTARAIVNASGILGRYPCSTPATQESNALSDNLGNVSFVAALVIIATGSDAALDKDLSTFSQILTARFTLLSPNDDIMPFGSLLPIAVRVRPLLRRGDGEARHSTARSCETHLGILP